MPGEQGRNDTEHTEHESDQAGLTKVRLDDFLEECTGERARDRAEDQEPSQALIGRSDGAAADGMDPCREVAGDVAPEVGKGAEERSHMKRHIEGLVEALVVQDGPVE